MTNKSKSRLKKPKFNTLNKTGQVIKKRVPFTKLLYISLAVNLVVLLFLFLFRDNIPPEIPLFYGLPEGESQLAQKESLVLPSLISIIIIVLNSLIAYYTKDDFIKKTLIIASFAITFLSTVTTLKIAFLVGSF